MPFRIEDCIQLNKDINGQTNHSKQDYHQASHISEFPKPISLSYQSNGSTLYFCAGIEIPHIHIKQSEKIKNCVFPAKNRSSNYKMCPKTRCKWGGIATTSRVTWPQLPIYFRAFIKAILMSLHVNHCFFWAPISVAVKALPLVNTEPQSVLDLNLGL